MGKATPPTRAAIYLRISKDTNGEHLGVERQEQDCRALAAAMGWEVAQVLTDNDISASTRSTKPRPAYADMLAGVRTGRFAVILAYSNSRLTRRPRELEDLIDLHASTGVLIKTVVSGEDDLSTADGRMVARIKANVDAAEAERTSERTRRQKQAALEQGTFRGGRRPFGYAADGVTIIPKEADMIEAATMQVLGGRSLSAIAKEWAASGVTTSTGQVWNYAKVKRVLARPRNAGLMSTGTFEDDDLVILDGAKATWPPIVSQDDFNALLAILGDPARRKGPDFATTKHLGSAIYRCARCAGPMRASTVREVPTYVCATHAHVTIKATPTDALVRGAVATLLADPAVIDAMTANTQAALEPQRAERRALQARLETTRDDYDNDLIDGARYKAKSAKIMAELEQVEARITDGVVAGSVSPIFHKADPAAAFLAAPLDLKRSVLRTLLRVSVAPAPYRGTAWSAERVRISPVVTITPEDEVA